MKHLFYFMAIFPILWELMAIQSPKRVHNFVMQYRENNNKDFDNCTPNQKAYVVCMLGYIIWTIAGLLTFQWSVFALLLITCIIPKKFIWLRWCDAVLTFILLVFIVLNAYHFNIDVLTFLRSII